MSSSLKSRAGLTLLEVAFASVMLAGVLLLLAGVVTSSTRSVRNTGENLQVRFAVEDVIETERARVKNDTSSAADLCGEGASHETRTYNGVEFDVETTVTAMKVDPNTNTLVSADCDDDAPIYQYDVMLSWDQNGETHQQPFQELVSTEEAVGPILKHFTANDEDTAWHPTPGSGTIHTSHTPGEVKLDWALDIGTQSLKTTLDGTDGTHVEDLPSTDSVWVVPAQSTEYTLTIENEAGVVRDTTRIYVDALNLGNFRSSVPIVGPEESFDLFWEYLGVTCDPRFERSNITADRAPNLGNMDCATETTVGPGEYITEDTTYTLSLDNLNDPSQTLGTATHTVEYSDTPVLEQFTVTPIEQCDANGNNTVEVEWTVYAASDIRLNGESVPRSGSKTVRIADDTTFELRATNNHGTTETWTRVADIIPIPSVSFNANPNPIVEGVDSILSWNVQDATRVTLNGSEVANPGSKTVYPTDDTTYEIGAINEGIEVTCVATPEDREVVVENIEFTNVRFTPNSITQEKTTTLRWDYTNTLNPAFHQVLLVDPENGTQDVTNQTSIDITPQNHGNLHYELRLLDREPSRTIDETTVPLDVAAKVRFDSFEANTPHVCGVERVTVSWATSHAENLTLNGSRVPADGNDQFTISSTRSFTLIGTNRLGDSESTQIEVTRTPTPTIIVYNATPDLVAEAAETQFNWVAYGGDRYSIDPLVGSVAAAGSTRTEQTQPETFTLRAERDTPGSRVCVTTHDQHVDYEPISIDSFNASKTVVSKDGTPNTFSWSISPYIDSNYHRVELLEAGNVVKDVTEETTTDYVATVLGETNYTLRVVRTDNGQVLDQTRREVLSVRLPEYRFEVSPVEKCEPLGLNGNEQQVPVTVEWQVRHATEATLNNSVLNLGNPNSWTSDSRTQWLYDSRSYTLTVENAAGDGYEETLHYTELAAPTVDMVTANNNAGSVTVPAGAPLAIQWRTTDAVGVGLSRWDGNRNWGIPNTNNLPADGIHNMYALDSGDYRIAPHSIHAECRSAHASLRTRAVEVNVRTPTLHVSGNDAITEGQTHTFTYRVSNGDSRYQKIQWRQGNGGWTDLPWSTSSRGVDARPNSTTDYEFRIVTKTTGDVLRTLERNLRVVPRPTVSLSGGVRNFFGEYRTMYCASNARLYIHWDASNAERVDIEAPELQLWRSNVQSSGTLSPRTYSTVTFRATATNELGFSVTDTLTIKEGTVPDIHTFEFNTQTQTPTKIIRDEIEMRWQTSNASRVTLNGDTVATTTQGTTRSVGTNAGAHKNFVLEAESSDGCTVSQTRRVKVADTYEVRVVPSSSTFQDSSRRDTLLDYLPYTSGGYSMKQTISQGGLACFYSAPDQSSFSANVAGSDTAGGWRSSWKPPHYYGLHWANNLINYYVNVEQASGAGSRTIYSSNNYSYQYHIEGGAKSELWHVGNGTNHGAKINYEFRNLSYGNRFCFDSVSGSPDLDWDWTCGIFCGSRDVAAGVRLVVRVK